MKACAEHKKELALLAISALEGAEAARVQAHVQSCGGCRGYLRELDEVAGKVRSAQSPEVEASPFLHRRVRNRLLETRSRSVFPWRLLIPALGAVMLVFFILPRGHQTPPPARGPVSPVIAVKSMDVTALNYQLAANQSLDHLDALLSEQGSRPLPAAPVLRASGSTSD